MDNLKVKALLFVLKLFGYAIIISTIVSLLIQLLEPVHMMLAALFAMIVFWGYLVYDDKLKELQRQHERKV